MMKFRSEYTPAPSALRLDPERPVTLLGSCFSANIGREMRRSRWEACVNPCGTLFNPASIRRVLEIAAIDDWEERDRRLAMTIARKDDYYVSMLMDSGFAGEDFNDCLNFCSNAVEELRGAVGNSQALIVTLGTAWVFSISGVPDYIVGNCHKFPAAKFDRRRLSVEDVGKEIELIEKAAREMNPEIEMIYTVSPVRHLRDDFHENTLSKATLQLALEGKEYFPAFEILLDDLRDYRFYAADLAHPSEEAVEYIWEKFRLTYLDPRGRELLDEGRALARMYEHRPQIVYGEGVKRFEEMRGEKARAFESAHPSMIPPVVPE